jgi:hypothetical protein
MELVIVAAFVVSLPSLAQAFNGGIGIAAAFVRFALALLVCWALGAIVERTIDMYVRDSRQREIERRVTESLKARQAFWKDPPDRDVEAP